MRMLVPAPSGFPPLRDSDIDAMSKTLAALQNAIPRTIEPLVKHTHEYQDVLVPLSLRELMDPHRKVFEEVGLNAGHVLEIVGYNWGWVDDVRQWTDLLAEQYFDDLNPRELFESYRDAVWDVQDRLRPHLYGLDARTPERRIDFIEIVGMEQQLRAPFFVLRLNYYLD